MAKIECPKCTYMSFLNFEGSDLVQHCPHCGFRKYFARKTPDGYMIYRQETATEGSLPRAGTKLRSCLGRLVAYTEITTEVMASVLDQDPSTTASQLTVLQAKGLAMRLNNQKGVAGGSTWKATVQAVKLMKLEA